MDFLTAILLGEDPLTQHPPTSQHPQTPPTSPTNLPEPVQDDKKVLGVTANTPPTTPNKTPIKPTQAQSVGESVGNVGGVLGKKPNIFILSESIENSFVGDVGGVRDLSGVSSDLKQCLEQHNPLSDAGWSGHWRERIQTQLQVLEDWVWRDEYDLMRVANNGLPRLREQAREKMTRWYFFMLEQERVSADETRNA